MAGKLIDSRNRILMNTPHSMDTSQSPIASFTTNSTLPLKSCKIWFQPTQDMHGYTKPWPAGGGNNLLPSFKNGGEDNDLTWTVSDDGTVTINGTASATTTIKAPNGTWQWDGTTACWLSGCPSGGNFSNGYSLRVDGPRTGNYSAPDIGSGVALSGYTSTNSIDNMNLHFCIVVRSGTVCTNLVFKPMLNLGSSAMPYAPYSNICPITGRAGMTVYQGPVSGDDDFVYWNQVIHNIDDTANYSNWAGAYGTVSYNGGRITFVPNNDTHPKNFGQKTGVSVAGIVGHKYYFTCRLTISNLRNKTPYIAPQIGYLIKVPNMTANVESTLCGVFTATTSNMLRFYFYPWDTSSVTTDGTEVAMVRDAMIVDLTAMFGAGNEPDTASAFKTLLPNVYYPYSAGVKTTLNVLNGTGAEATYEVEFTSAPDGVVYGGYVDLARGTLTATKVIRKINYCDGVFGATNYGYAVYVTLSNKTTNTDTTSNMFQKSTQTYTAAPLYSYPTSSGANTTWTFILPSTVTSKAEANAWLAALDPPLVVTENLATPVTYEIPKEKIKTMLGLNNFWTDDANDTIAVSYWEH